MFRIGEVPLVTSLDLFCTYSSAVIGPPTPFSVPIVLHLHSEEAGQTRDTLFPKHSTSQSNHIPSLCPPPSVEIFVPSLQFSYE